MSKKSKWSVFVFALSLAAATPLFAQNAPPGGGGPGGDPNGGPGGGPGGGGPGGRGGPPDPAERRQHELQDIQEDMNVSEDKWKDLSPKLEKLMVLHEAISPHGGPPHRPDDDAKDQDPVHKALDDLREALNDQDAKADDIKAKVDAYEKAKADASAELKKEEEELKATLTPLQQAILIAHGVLD